MSLSRNIKVYIYSFYTMVFRVFSGIIWLVFFLVLVLVTFFSWGNSGLQSVPVQTESIGLFMMNWSWQISQVSEVSGVDSGFYFEKITDVDTIYFSPWSQYSIAWNNISLWKWEFIINVESLSSTYAISSNFFSISSLEAGSVYINTQSDRNYVLLSLDTLVNVWFTNEGEDITYVDLYPHMYLRLNPTRLQFLKNADLVRISSVFTLGALIASISDDIISWFLKSTWIESSTFFDSYLSHSKIEFDKNAEDFKKILSIKSGEFPWVKSLQKYFYLFLNDTKKRAYYKNSIFSDLTRLLHSDKKETQTIQDIVSQLSALEDTPDDYREIRNVIDFYYSLAATDSNFSHLSAKINIHALMLEIHQKTLSPYQESLLSLSTLYQNYNISGDYSYENLSSFSNDYIKRSWLDDDKISLKKKQHFDYFSFFLSELFISRFSSTDENLRDFWLNDNFNSLLKVMSDYVDISQKIYTPDEEKRSITGMYVHADVLKKLQDFMRSALFKDIRWENGVLIKSRKFEIDARETTLFEKNINTLISFYEDNKNFLSNQDQNDSALINSYKIFDSQFKEYFLALTDYENYLYSYDETKKNLFWIETFGARDNDIVFSEGQGLNYLRKFSQASLSDVKIKLKEDYYEIENFIVDGKNFSFSLYPYEAHKIDNIIINNKPTSVSYKLDSVEIDWNERSESARDEEEEKKYDFSRFFLNTFSETSTDNNQEIFDIDRSDNVNNDKFIVVFKRDKLLGDGWEFASVQSFLDIDFADIDVVQNQSLYDIFINEADIKVSYENTDITASFDSSYVLAADKHYFKNIRLSPYISNLWIKKPEIGDSFIQVVGNINLVDLKSEMEIFAENYDNLKYIYKSISKNLWTQDISIRYLKSSQKLNFRFDYQWDFISILLSRDTIENISQGWEIILRNANYRTIDDILTTIKK